MRVGDLYALKTSASIVTVAALYLSWLVSAVDVIHAVAIPCACVKADAIPGRLAEVAFELLLLGRYNGQCSELCGALHGFMPLNLISL